MTWESEKNEFLEPTFIFLIIQDFEYIHIGIKYHINTQTTINYENMIRHLTLLFSFLLLRIC